jgi:hypothetical protein
MPKNRKAAESAIFTFLAEIEPTLFNVSQYKKIFASMDDKGFDLYMQGLRDKTKT